MSGYQSLGNRAFGVVLPKASPLAWSFCVLALTVASAGADQTIYPVKDGTIVDGGIFGPFDGVPDDRDWSFNGSSYEGAITLTTDPPASSLEGRVVWEYSLSSVALAPPVSATLTFTLRGAPIFPLPDVHVHVYSYPADLVESDDDFSAGPAVFQGSAIVGAFQSPTVFSVNVSDVINESLASGSDRAAFRFQVDPQTVNTVNQAFIDALDSDVTTKPFLTIGEGGLPGPGDYDGDGDVDLVDFAQFSNCETTGGAGAGCDVFDFDTDGDVDLSDFSVFQVVFTE